MSRLPGVPKYIPINGLGDLRPISVTPILSRMLEHLVVKYHISPTISPGELCDQYGFNLRAVPRPRYLIEPTMFPLCCKTANMCDVCLLTFLKLSTLLTTLCL